MDYRLYLSQKITDLTDDAYLDKLILHYENDFLEQFETVFNSLKHINSLWWESKTKYLELIKEAEIDKLGSGHLFLEHIKKSKNDRETFLIFLIRQGLQGIFPDLYLLAPILLKIIEESEKHKASDKKDLKRMTLFKMVIPHFFNINIDPSQTLNPFLLETHVYPFLFKVLGLKLDSNIHRHLQRLIHCARIFNSEISQKKLAEIFGVDRKTIREANMIKLHLNTDRLNREQITDYMDDVYEALQEAQGKELKNSDKFRPSKEIKELIKKITES